MKSMNIERRKKANYTILSLSKRRRTENSFENGEQNVLSVIHLFQDGNGRVCRLIMFKECLRNHIVSFIITEELKLCYYRGRKEWQQKKVTRREPA